MKLKTKFDTAWAHPDKLFTMKVNEWRHMRPVVRTEKCTRCSICRTFCPTGCIEERQTHYDANLEYCKGCGLCARTCPAEAIEMVMEV